MIEIKIPYSHGYKLLKIEEDRFMGLLKAKSDNPEGSGEEIVSKALENPLGSDRLENMVGGKNNILIITSDHTRPMPSKITMPLILNEIRGANTEVNIKILIATGFHRSTRRDEILERFGASIAKGEDIIVHDSRNKDEMVYKGILPSGGELWLNSLIDWADFIMAEGFIEPHFFAGFSGGRKSILPGIASEKTVFANHCSEFIANSHATTGNLFKNPIHEDMVYAADRAKLEFILNVTLDRDKNITRAFAGHPIIAHERGCSHVKEVGRVNPIKADIVITSNGGYPLDQNIYQAVKGMTAAEACVNQGGVIIMASACEDGHGGEAFYNWFVESASAEEVEKRILAIPGDRTMADQWEAQILARVLMKAHVIMVTEEHNRETVTNMKMTYTKSLREALEIATKRLGKKAGVVVIPDGASVII